MLNTYTKKMIILSSVLTAAGLILMFSSVAIGTSLGNAWLLEQPDSIADTSEYNRIVNTYKNNFVIIGSLMLGLGLLTAWNIYMKYLNFDMKTSQHS